MTQTHNTQAPFTPLAVAPVVTVGEVPPPVTKETFDLIVPIQRPGQPPIEALAADEPALYHKSDYERIEDAGEATVAIIASLTGITPADAGALMPFDSQPISEWIMGRMNLQLWEPKRNARGAELPLIEQLRDHPLSLTIALDHAVTLDGVTIDKLTVKAPTLASAVGLGKLKTTAEQTAMMITKLAGIPYPHAMRLRLVDVAKVEAYLAPFYPRGPMPRRPSRATTAAPATT